MNNHYKKGEKKRKERQVNIKLKIVDSYGSIIGNNTSLQKSKYRRKCS